MMCHKKKKLSHSLTKSSYAAVVICFLFRRYRVDWRWAFTDGVRNFIVFLLFCWNWKMNTQEGVFLLMLVVVGLYLSLQLPLSPIKSNSRRCLRVWERHTDTHKCLITGLVPYKSNQKVRDALIPLFRCLFKVILRSFILFLWLSTVLMRVWITARGKKKRASGEITVFHGFFSDVQMWVSDTVVHTCKDQTTLAEGKSDFCGFFFFGGGLNIVLDDYNILVAVLYLMVTACQPKARVCLKTTTVSWYMVVYHIVIVLYTWVGSHVTLANSVNWGDTLYLCICLNSALVSK